LYCGSVRLVYCMMQNLPKPIKRVLRQLMDVAYERELHRELEKLDQSFAAWREGTISSFELNELIHKHHDGPSRELWSRYRNVRAADMLVTSAVVEGLIKEEEVPVRCWQPSAGSSPSTARGRSAKHHTSPKRRSPKQHCLGRFIGAQKERDSSMLWLASLSLCQGGRRGGLS
jgi:hypothetical protein